VRRRALTYSEGQLVLFAVFVGDFTVALCRVIASSSFDVSSSCESSCESLLESKSW
jgi:hypothetical protein